MSPASRNQLLRALPAALMDELQSCGKDIQLPPGTVLQQNGSAIEHIVFLHGGLCILLTELGGAIAEAGFVGREGVIGTLFTSPQRKSFTRAVLVTKGSAFRLPFVSFEKVMQKSSLLQALVAENNARIAQRAQRIAGCNLLHRLDGRIGRWLWQVAQFGNEASVAITQDILSHMLGVTRARLNEALQNLENAGAIANRRGVIEIVDASILQKHACCRSPTDE